jgi:hypothetical protein
VKIAWGRVPWTLWVHAVISIGGALVVLVKAGSDTPALALALFVAVEVGWVYLLFRGIRWVWIATLVVLIFGTADTLAFGPRTWWGLSSTVVTVVLLLLPITRKYFAKEPVEAAA